MHESKAEAVLRNKELFTKAGNEPSFTRGADSLHIDSIIVRTSEINFLGDRAAEWAWPQLPEGNKFTEGPGKDLAVSAPLTIPGKS